MKNCMLFKTFVKKYKRSFNEQAYDVEIQYRAIVFQQYAYKYQSYVKEHSLANDYCMIAHEVNEYEKRIQAY